MSLLGRLQFRPLSAGSRLVRNMSGVVPVPEAQRFVADCLIKVGATRQHAGQMADLLVAADRRGHFSHGMNRLDMYVNDVRGGLCDPNAVPQVLKQTAATAWVDGHNGFGAVVGNFCMQLAMEKARSAGVGWVVAKGSNHYGIAGWYTLMASQDGLLGMSCTNTSPLMTPTRAKEAALGTNPISLSAPSQNGDSFDLDMATTTVAVGKIEMQIRKKEPIPHGWAQDTEGNITTDAQKAFDSHCLLPLGGAEETSGYKGYGLGLMVETFSAILSGSAFGPNIRSWMGGTTPANLGQCFVAIDPECFAPGFKDRMADLMQHLRNMESVDPSKPVLVPGDPERIYIQKVEEEGGIQYHENQIKASVALAEALGVCPMKQL